MTTKYIRYNNAIYVLAKNNTIPDEGDFIGYHCQKRQRPVQTDIKTEDKIGLGYTSGMGAGYGMYFGEILDAIPYELRMKAMEKGLMDRPENEYDDDFDEWYDKVEDFLENNNIRWIFVSSTKSLIQYGEWCYKMYLEDKARLLTIEDIQAEDAAAVYIYDGSKGSPIAIEVEEEEEDGPSYY